MRHEHVYIRHILDEVNFLIKTTEGLTFEEFIKNEVVKRACSRSLEIIGEAVKNLSDGFRKKYKDIEWKKFSGLRDKVIHYYFGVDWDIVWDVIKNKIPYLKVQAEKIPGETA